MRRKDDWPEAALPCVGDVFSIKEKTDLLVGLFAKDTEHPKMSCSGAVSQYLAACVIRLEACFEIGFSFKQQCRIQSALRYEWQSLVTCQVFCLCIGEGVSRK